MNDFTFNEWRYLYPPRPDSAIVHNMLPFYEKRGWWAQIKMNGTCNVFGACGSTFKAMNRHNEDHKQWDPNAENADLLCRVSNGKWIVVVAELLHHKVPGIKNINYINDLLVWNGEFLYGTTFAERQQMLLDIVKDHITGETEFYYELGPNFWLAKRVENVQATFKALSKPEHEGIVMKDPKATLNFCSKPTSNVSWEVKCRKPTKNYGF